MNSNYKNLIVWQKSMDLVMSIYSLTSKYPEHEKYCLRSHTNKTVISIPSNIAEGRRRESDKEFRRFLLISYGSGAELETQLEIAKRLKYLTPKEYKKSELLLEEVMKMLNTLIHK